MRTRTTVDEERWFETLWSDHADQVMAYARRRADDEIARDVVAGTFLVAWRRRDDVPDDPLPWLYGVARRVLADQRRTRRRQARLAERVGRHAADPAMDDPSKTLARRDSILRALERLSEDDREVLRLVCWEQLSSKEAAAVVGCSPATFAVRLHRARRRLRRHLDTIDEAPRGAGARDEPRVRTGLSERTTGVTDAG